MANETIDIYFSFDLNKLNGDYESFDGFVPFNIKLDFGKLAGERQLSTPKGLTYNAESAQISIREVSGATGYLVEYLDELNNVVGSETIETATASLQKLPNVPGSYNIRVTALGDGDKLLDSESYTTTNAPIFREGALFSTDWKTQVTNAGIDLQQLTDISFVNQKPQESATYGVTSVQTDTYTLNENINVGDGIEVYVSSDNKKLIFYSQDVICSQDGVAFDFLIKMTNYSFQNFNTSLMTSMGGMFWNNTELKKIELTGFDSSNVTSLINMFCDCPSLEVADVSSLVTNKVKNFQGVFARCYKLYNINMYNFDFSSATNLNYFFESCPLTKGSVITKDGSQFVNLGLVDWSKTRGEDGMIRWGIALQSAGLNAETFTEFYLTTNKEMVQGTRNENVKIVGTDVETYIDGTKIYFYSENQIKMKSTAMWFEGYNLLKVYVDAVDFSNIENINSTFSSCWRNSCAFT